MTTRPPVVYSNSDFGFWSVTSPSLKHAELANVVERAVVLGSGPNITVSDLPARITVGAERASPKGFLIAKQWKPRRDLVMNALRDFPSSTKYPANLRRR